MKKIIVVMLLGIVLIGTGAKNKLDAQFPYQLDVASDSKAAVQAMTFSPQEKTLDELADNMGIWCAWSEEQTDTGSTLVTAEGAAGYDFMRREDGYEIRFRVLPDGRMRIDSTTLNGQSTSLDRVLELFAQSAEQLERIKGRQTPKVMARSE